MVEQLTHFTFTYFYDNEEKAVSQIKDVCAKLGSNFYVFGKEICPKTGNKHLQGYCQLHYKKRFKQIAKEINWHIEHPKTDAETNINYCKKADSKLKASDWEEWGTPRVSNNKRIDKQARWTKAIKKAKLGAWDELEEEDPVLYITHRKTWIDIGYEESSKSFQCSPKLCLWIVGPSGIGKSRWIHVNFPQAYIRPAGLWWTGYNDQKTVVFEDYDREYCSKNDLKCWADSYESLVRVHYGMKKTCYRLLIISSNYSINDIYGQDPDHLAIRRRFIEFNASKYIERHDDLVGRMENVHNLNLKGLLCNYDIIF